MPQVGREKLLQKTEQLYKAPDTKETIGISSKINYDYCFLIPGFINSLQCEYLVNAILKQIHTTNETFMIHESATSLFTLYCLFKYDLKNEAILFKYQLNVTGF